MKNLSVILNVALLVAVATLYYLHFRASAGSTTESVPAAATGGVSIVYINTDTLLNNYAFFKQKKAEFDRKNEDINKELSAENNRLQAEVNRYKQQGQNMTIDQRAQTEEQLLIKQQNLMKRKEALFGALDEEQNKFHTILYDRLNTYLEKYNKEKHHSFILGYSKGGGILLANDQLDVTKQVLEGLNKEFSEQK